MLIYGPVQQEFGVTLRRPPAIDCMYDSQKNQSIIGIQVYGVTHSLKRTFVSIIEQGPTIGGNLIKFQSNTGAFQAQSGSGAAGEGGNN